MLTCWFRPWLRAAAPLWAAAWLAGCYTYAPLASVDPEPDRTFAFDLTDQGRVALAAGIGSGTDRIEGRLVDLTDTTYGVSVARVVDIRGTVAPWTGEVVSLRREYVGTVRERHMSVARTAIAVATSTAAIVAFAATRGLGVFGNATDQPPGEKPPGVDASRVFPLTLLISR